MNNLYGVIIKGRSFNKDDEPIMFATYIPIETVNLIISQYGNVGFVIKIYKIPNYITMDDKRLEQFINKKKNID